jgi:hypothetical protein
MGDRRRLVAGLTPWLLSEACALWCLFNSFYFRFCLLCLLTIRRAHDKISHNTPYTIVYMNLGSFHNLHDPFNGSNRIHLALPMALSMACPCILSRTALSRPKFTALAKTTATMHGSIDRVGFITCVWIQRHIHTRCTSHQANTNLSSSRLCTLVLS